MFKSLAALLLLATPAIAGTNSGNYNDGISAASAFCWAVSTRAWSYVGGSVNPTRDPVLGDFERAALAVGSELESIYAVDLPASHRRAFRGGWETGMKSCAKKLHY